MATRYTASKSLSQGRSSYVMSFRHPLRKDPKTGKGIKIRKGLGTSDEVKADLLVAEMNELLGDEKYHTISMKSEAKRKFSDLVVNAFYSDIENINTDNWSLRERYIKLPGKDDGYSRVMLVGTTGAGKTSLLRHLIGSDPKRDRFPSTSTAKTTIAETEIIIGESPYQVVATFFSEFYVRASIHECLFKACLEAKKGLGDEDHAVIDKKIADKLLNHSDQKFRLSYTLGSWNPQINDQSEDEDEWSEEEDVESTEVDKIQLQKILENYVSRIWKITQASIEILKDKINDIESESSDPETAEEELFEKCIIDQNDFSELIHDILDEIQKRFDLLTGGILSRRSSGWPEVWTYQNEDRSEFIEKVRQLFGNSVFHFGTLLTPIVEGVRVKGPFNPVFSSKKLQLVFIDGQGLGHTPDSASSVTTHITERFKDVDLILLVDTAKQPMQAAPLSVIRSIAASGYQNKLAIAFTHFDQVEGTNLKGLSAKKEHVLASLMNGLNSLSDALGVQAIRPIERNVNDCVFMIGGLDRSLQQVAEKSKNRSELERLIDFCQNAIQDGIEVNAKPIYDIPFLMYALQTATNDFKQRWDALLGLRSLDGVNKEHVNRIKALNRRMADHIDIEYDTLRPVADLLARLNEGINRFLSQPSAWTSNLKTEEEEDTIISAIKQKVHNELSVRVRYRIVNNPLKEWQRAFQYSGRGSTFDRAKDIQSIYNTAAPELNENLIENTVTREIAREFLNEILQIVCDAIKEQGGQVRV